MSLRCFYVVDGAAVGPVSTEQLMDLGRSSAFTAETLVWIEGTADWQPFSRWSGESEPLEFRAPEPPSAAPVAVEPVAVERFASAPVAREPLAANLQKEPPLAEPITSFASSPLSEPGKTAQSPIQEPPQTVEAKAPKGGRLFRTLSWLSLISLALFLATAGVRLLLSPDSSLAGMLTGSGSGALRVLFGLSVLSGLAALFGFRRFQTWQVIAPASVALVTNALLLVLALPAAGMPGFLPSPQRSRGLSIRSNGMTPVKTVAGANRLSHPTLGFTFDVPAGFEEIPLTKSSAKLWKLFGKPAVPNELAEVVGIQPLGTKLQRHLDIRQIPTDGNVNLSRLSWRGVEIDAIRISEAKDGNNYVTYNVQVPLKGEAIQLMLGAPRERETELKARIEALLASLDGQSDW